MPVRAAISVVVVSYPDRVAPPVRLVHGPPGESAARKTLWIIAAVLALTVDPFLVWFVAAIGFGWPRDCSGPLDQAPPGCPREGLGALVGLFLLACWMLITACAALAFGIAEGTQGRFARGNVVAAILVGLGMPWALVAYAFAFGVTRLVRLAFRR